MRQHDYEDYVTCPICGKSDLVRLISHVRITHKLDKDSFMRLYPNQDLLSCDFKDKFKQRLELAWNEHLRDPEIRKKMQENGRRSMAKLRSNKDLVDKLNQMASERLKALHQNPEWEKKLLDSAAASRKNPEYAKKANERLVKGFLKWLSDPTNYESHIRKIGESRSKKWEDPKFRSSVRSALASRKPFVNPISGEIIYMRSSWEVRLAGMLSDLSIRFVYEPFVIKYEFHGKLRRYTPDFYLPDFNLIIEIHPSNLIDEVMLAKEEYSKSAGFNFIFLTSLNDVSNISEILQSVVTQ